MPRLAERATVYVDQRRRRLFIDGEEFPWFTNGISFERPDTGCGYLTVRIPVETYREVQATIGEVTDDGGQATDPRRQG